MSWSGSSAARSAVGETTSAALHPMPTESLNWDSSPHSFVEADNLEALRALQRAYTNSVKMIYMDPPYNTGKDFVYVDNFAQTANEYLLSSGQADLSGARLVSNPETSGRYHSSWLSMMYPRLALARNLLTDDGVIFVSIDDHEVHNLRLILDEIFGLGNFVAQMVWAAGRKNDSRRVSVSHEYILVYAKDSASLSETSPWRNKKEGIEKIYAAYKTLKRKHGSDNFAIERDLKQWYRDLPDSEPAKRHKHYSKVDAKGIFFGDNISWPGGGGPTYTLIHPVTNKPCAVPSRGWLYSETKMQEMVKAGLIFFGLDENIVPTVKKYLIENEEEVPYSVFYQDGRAATKRLMTLMGGKVFDYPKDEKIIQRIVEFATASDSLVMDLFAGSGSTGHAVLAQNKSDGGNRKYVLVTLPEETPVGSQARKAGYETISQLSLTRLKKADAQINGHESEVGVRAFKIRESNFNVWKHEPNEPLPDLTLFSSSLTAEPEGLSVAWELFVKMGVKLDAAVVNAETPGVEAYWEPKTKTVVCVGGLFIEDSLVSLLSLKAERVVFVDDIFNGNDALKQNAILELTHSGVSKIRSL